MSMLQEKRNFSMKQDKVSMQVLLCASSQSGFPKPISAQCCHYIETRKIGGTSNYELVST